MAKGVIHAGKGTNLSSGNAVENERDGWDEAAYRRKNDNPMNNYDWSRHDLNFEVVDDCIMPLGSQETSLYQRYQNRLKVLNFKEYKAGATNQQITYVELIASGSTDRMQKLAFGNQVVNYERNPKTWHNWGVHREKPIEEWALDTYRFVCQLYGRENIIGFEVHLDETEPHAHVNVVPTAIKKQRGNVGGYVKVDAEGNPVTYTKGKHIGEVIKLSKGKYDALPEDKKKEYRPAVRGSFRTISFAEHFGSTRTQRSQKMSELHDRYYEQVGKKWGLERGDVWKDLPEEERRKRRRRTKKEAYEEEQAKAAKEKADKERDESIEKRDAVAEEVAQLNATVGTNQQKIQHQVASIEENNTIIIKQLDTISDNMKEVRSIEEASLFDKLKRHGINPDVRRAIEEEDNRHQEEIAQAESRHQEELARAENRHKEELAKARMATWENGKTITWENGGQLTWEDYARYMEKQAKDGEERAEKEKTDAVLKAKQELKDSHDANIRDLKSKHKAELDKLNKAHEKAIEKERLAFNSNGRPVQWGDGPKKGLQLTKQEWIDNLVAQVARYKETDYERRLKEAKELVIATFSMDYKKVLSILLDYMKRGLKEFAKDAMALLQTIVFAAEKTTKGRKAYLDDAFKNAKLLALLDPDIKDIKEQKELREDAMRIVDGTWQSYRDERVRQQKRNELLNAAVDAVVEMANAPRQKLLNANQAATIDKFLRFDGGDRNKLFDEIWQSAKSQIRNEGWQRIAISALDSYKQHGHTQGQGKGRGVV